MKKAILYVLLMYPILVGVFYLFQNQILFHEKKLSQNFEYNFGTKFSELWLTSTDSIKLNTIHFYTEKTAKKGIVVYLHGNSDNLSRWGKHAPEFLRNGYDVVMIDYRGFGKSDGRFSEKGLIADGEAAYDYAKSLWPESNIVIYGRSLGSGIAAQIALKNKPKMLLLETPYTSLPAVAKQFVPVLPYQKISRYQLNTEAIIDKISCPIHLFHGTNDGLVYYESSVKLAKKLEAKQKNVLTTIVGGKHKNLATFKEYHKALDSCLVL